MTYMSNHATAAPNTITAGQVIITDGYHNEALYPTLDNNTPAAWEAYNAKMTGPRTVVKVTEHQVTNTGGRSRRRIRVYRLHFADGEYAQVTSAAKIKLP